MDTYTRTNTNTHTYTHTNTLKHTHRALFGVRFSSGFVAGGLGKGVHQDLRTVDEAAAPCGI